MKSPSAGILLVLPCLLGQVSAIYNPLREYAGPTFFDKFAYYGNVDNTTWGNVTYLDQTNATSQGLTFINGAGNAVVKVDDTSTIVAGAPGEAVNRNSIRLTSLDSYGLGSLIIIDVVHMPYGCSVWPAFWTYGIETEWPGSGEIDIIEAINVMDHNQIALHTLQGCSSPQQPITPPTQTGSTLETDCSTPRGCIVAETKPNSFGAGFAQAGGGVYAVQMEASGIYLWFWSRPDVPANIKAATSTSQMDTTTWGIPTAAYPSGSTCNITQFFPPQNLVLLTTLCGVWAGIPSIYNSACPGDCFADNILGNGSNYANAFWEISYIRTYLSDTALPVTNTPAPTTTPPAAIESGTTAPSTTKTITESVGTDSPPVAPPGSAATSVWQDSQLFLGCLAATVIPLLLSVTAL